MRHKHLSKIPLIPLFPVIIVTLVITCGRVDQPDTIKGSEVKQKIGDAIMNSWILYSAIVTPYIPASSGSGSTYSVYALLDPYMTEASSQIQEARYYKTADVDRCITQIETAILSPAALAPASNSYMAALNGTNNSLGFGFFTAIWACDLKPDR